MTASGHFPCGCLWSSGSPSGVKRDYLSLDGLDLELRTCQHGNTRSQVLSPIPARRLHQLLEISGHLGELPEETNPAAHVRALDLQRRQREIGTGILKTVEEMIVWETAALRRALAYPPVADPGYPPEDENRLRAPVGDTEHLCTRCERTVSEVRPRDGLCLNCVSTIADIAMWAVNYVTRRVIEDPNVGYYCGWGTEVFRRLCHAEAASSGRRFSEVEQHLRKCVAHLAWEGGRKETDLARLQACLDELERTT